jgi:hypothetical protein
LYLNSVCKRCQFLYRYLTELQSWPKVTYLHMCNILVC